MGNADGLHTGRNCGDLQQNHSRCQLPIIRIQAEAGQVMHGVIFLLVNQEG